MNRDRLKGGWKQLSGKVQVKWGRLTGDQASVNAGRRAQRAGRIQSQYGVSKEQAQRQLEDFLSRNRDWYSAIR